MNKYIDYIGTETEYSDGTKAFAEKSDGTEVNICEKDGYTTVQVKPFSKKRTRKLKILLRFREDISDKNVLVHGSFRSGFKKVSEIKEEITGRYFFSVFDENGVGISFMNAIPAKFDTRLQLVRKRNVMSKKGLM